MANAWTQFQPWQNQPLPPGWEARYDANIRRYYFIDHTTHKTTWQDPRVKKPEAIPLNQFKKSSNTGGRSNQLETSFGGTSSQAGSSSRQAAAAAPKPVEPQRPASFGDADDDFPIDSFLADMLKEDKSEEDKENLKKKMIREFPGVDEVVIDVSLRSAKYDESKSREIIKKLKGDDDKQRAPAKAKTQEPSKPKEKTTTGSSAAKSSSAEELNKAKTKASAAAAAAKAKSSSQELHAKATTPAATAAATAGPKTVKSTSPASSKVTVATKVTTGGRSDKKPAATQSAQAQHKMALVARRVYHSPLVSVPNGPNPANTQGPNPLMLLPEWVQPEGPQRQNRAGPQRSNRQGPTRRPTARKVPQNCGAQANNRKGPNVNLVVGSMYASSSAV